MFVEPVHTTGPQCLDGTAADAKILVLFDCLDQDRYCLFGLGTHGT